MSKAVRSTIAGRPGVANIDSPGDLLRKSSDIALPSQVTAVIKAPIMRRPLEAAVKEAVDLLSKAERPLIIVGKAQPFLKKQTVSLETSLQRPTCHFCQVPKAKAAVRT